MSDRKVSVTLSADVAEYLEAMKVATQATDTLSAAVKRLRVEKTLALAGNIDEDDAREVARQALAQFNLSDDDLERVVDVVAAGK